MPKTKFLFKFFPVLLITCNLWAVPFNVEVVKEGSGDTIRAGQLIQVHYKGFLLADLKDSSKVADTTAAATPTIIAITGLIPPSGSSALSVTGAFSVFSSVRPAVGASVGTSVGASVGGSAAGSVGVSVTVSVSSGVAEVSGSSVVTEAG